MNGKNQRIVFCAVIFFAIAVIMSSCGDDSKKADSASSPSASPSPAVYTDIVINEVQSNATTNYLSSDFVELYNKSSQPYTFGTKEWYITDSDGAASHIFYIPAGTIIAANGYLVLLPDSTAVPTDAPSGSLACVADGTNIAFGLGKTDSVSLFFTGSANTTPATAVDTTAWTGVHVTTRVRLPDGSSWDSADTHTPTPGATNK